MRRFDWTALLVTCIFLQGCPTDVPRTNPFDPQSIDPAPGSLRGQVEAPTLSSAAGIRVRLFDGPTTVSPALTDNDGGFFFSGLEHGHYNLEISEEGFQRLVIYRLNVPQGGTFDLGVISLVPLSETDEASVLRGQVSLEGMEFHGGVHVSTVARPFDTFTRMDGSWQLVVPSGTYDIEFSHADYQTFMQADVQVGTGETHILEPLVLLAEPATITGTVLRRTCAPDPGDEVEIAAEDALITALGTGQTGLADEEGVFAVTGLSAGVYTVRAVLDGHEAAQVAGLSVRGGQVLQVPQALVVVASKGAIVGRILASGESDHSGTVVQLSGTGFGAFTSGDGSFRIAGVCSGQGYQITATRPGFLTASRGGITVEPGETAVVAELTMERQQGGLVLNGGNAFSGAASRQVSYVLTAPAGSTEMRMSEDASLFDDAARADEGWEPYLRDGYFTLSPGEGTKRVQAQVRGGGSASGVLEATAVLDLTPPADPRVVIEDGGTYSNDPDGALLLTLTATEMPGAGVDRVSGLAWLKLVNHDLQGGGAPPSSSDDPAWVDAPQLVYARTLDHPLIRPLVDEEKEVWVRFGDLAGNWSSPVSARVMLDRRAPESLSVSVLGSAPGWVNSGMVTVAFTAVDENPGVTMRVSNDSAFTGASWTPFNPEITWFLSPGDGAKEVWVQFRDAAGNRTQALVDQVVLDTQPPSGARLGIVEAPYSPVRDVTLAVSAQGADAMSFSLQPDFTDSDGAPEAWLPFGVTHAVSLPDADGAHTVYGKFRDEALNETVRLSATVVLDRSPPSVAGVSIAEGSHVPSPVVTLLTTAVPGERDAHEMRVDVVHVATSARTSGTFGPYNPSQTLTLPAPAGEKQVEVFLRDAAGNVSPQPGTVLVDYDPDPPIIASVILAAGADFTATTEVSVDIEATGAAQMMVSNRADFGGAVWQPFAATFAWNLPPGDDVHFVHVRLRDLAGNTAYSSAFIRLDRTGPVSTVVRIDGGAAFSRTGTVDLVLEAVDTGSGLASVHVSNDQGFAGSEELVWPAGAGSVGRAGWVLSPGDGLRTVYARFVDAAGNPSPSAGSIVVDGTPPGGSVMINGGAAFATTRAVTLSLASASDVSRVAVSNGSGCASPSWQAFTSTLSWDLATGGDGPRTVSVCFEDAAGNTSEASTSIVLDTTPPSGTLLIDGGAAYTISPTVTLSISAGPDVQAMAVANGGLDCATASYVGFSPVTTWSIGTGDGEKTVTVCLRDAAGLLGSIIDTIILDTTPPLGTIELAGGSAWTTSRTVAVALSFPADTNGWALGQPGIPCATTPYSDVVVGVTSASAGYELPPGDGPKTVVACFRDVAGNFASAVGSVALDTLAPTGTITIDGGAGHATATGVTLSFTASPDTIELAVSNAALTCSNVSVWPAYSPSMAWILEGATDGVKTVYACFRDAAGLTGSAVASIVLDREDPNGTLLIDGGASHATRRFVELTVSADPDTAWMSVGNGALDCATAVYEPFASSRPWTLSAGDGTKTVVVCLRDAAGRLGFSSASIELNELPPIGTIVLQGGAAYATSVWVSVDLTFPSDTDGYSLSNGSAICSGSFLPVTVGTTSLSVPDPHALTTLDGAKTVGVCFRDTAGNTAAAHASIVLDTTPPAGTVVIDGGASHATSTAVTLTFSAPPDTERVAVSNSAIGCATATYEAFVSGRAWTLDGASDGAKTVSVCFRDAAGNTAPAQASIILDRVDPVGTVVIDGGATHATSTAVTLSLTAVADVVGYAVANGGSLACASATYEDLVSQRGWILPTGDGTKSVTVCFRDAAGRTGSAGDSIILDTSPPAGTLVLAGGDAYATAHSITASLTFPNDVVGRALAENGLDCSTASYTPVTIGTTSQSPSFTLSSGDGTKTVVACFKDAAGNVAYAADSIILDTSPPSGTVSIDAGAAYATSAEVTLHLSAPADTSHVAMANASTINCLNPPNAYETHAATKSWTLAVGDGLKTVSVCFRDHAGNTAAASDTIVLDTGLPEGTIEINGGAPYATSTVVTLGLLAPADTVAMALANGGSLACANAAYEAFSSQRSWVLPSGDGTKQVAVCFKDAAGNTASAVASIELDTVPPVGTIQLAGGAAYTRVASVAVVLTHPDDTNGYALANAALDCAGASYTSVAPGSTSTATTWSLPAGDGTKTVAACFRDVAGNTASAAASIVLDETPPTGAGIVISPVPFSTTTTVTAALQVSGAHQMCLWGDLVAGSTDACASVGWEPLLGSKALTLTAGDGLKTVRAVFRDAAGWVTAPVEAATLLDTTAPDVVDASISLTGRARTGSSTSLTRLANVTVALADFPDENFSRPDPSGLPFMRVSENAAFSGAGWQPYSTSFAWVLSGGDGQKTLYVQVRDGAGNVSDPVTAGITLDQTPPRPGSVLINDGATYAGSTNATITFWVGGDAEQWSLDGGQTWSACQAAICSAALPGESHPHVLSPGDGLKRVQVVFQDAAGNVSETYAADIFLDATPPSLAGALLSLVSPTNNGFTNSVSVNASLTHSSDATHMRVAAAAGASCVASDMDGVTAQPVASTFTFLLPAGDGTKLVCARLLDAAGNESGFLSGTIILDTVPPTTPQIVTQSQVVRLNNGAAFVVDIAAPVSDTNFWRYERLGGTTTSWTAVSEVVGTTAFSFNLLSNNVAGRSETGVPNLLRLRAVDRAGNVSPESSVVITADVVAPSPVTMNGLWVRNASGKATVYWQPSASPDVVGYQVFYGTAAQLYNGLHADQGASPILLGNQTSVVLSGLTDGAATYVTVRPVDHAGHVGSSPAAPNQEVVLWPNRVPLNPLHRISLPGVNIRQLARYGDHVYVAAITSSCNPGLLTSLYAVDASRKVSPVQGGVIQTDPEGPVVVWSDTYDDGTFCHPGYSTPILGGPALVIDGSWMFLASGTKLHIFDLLVPSSPNLRTSLDFSPLNLWAMDVRGPTAFLAGHDPTVATESLRGRVIALDVSKLYDEDAATLPTTADEIGRVVPSHWTHATYWPAGIMWSRNRVVTNAFGGGYLRSYAIDDALDDDPFTVFDRLDYKENALFGNTWGNPPQSGNYGYFTDSHALHVMDLTSLWSGTGRLDPVNSRIVSGGQGAHGTFQIAGGQAFIGDSAARGVRGYDLSFLPAIDMVAYYPGTTPATTTLTWGNYLFTLERHNMLTVFEIASPRIMTLATSISGANHLHELQGAFVYGGQGKVVDLQAGWPPPLLGPSAGLTACSRAVTAFEDGSVSTGQDGTLRVHHHEKTIDRNVATQAVLDTPGFEDGDIYDVHFPLGTQATGLAMHGNYLVVAQRRADGIWLEVFDATPLRDYRPTRLDASRSVGEIRISTLTQSPDKRWATVSMHRGRALVGVDAGTGSYAGLIIVDLRPLLDGDPTTVMTADHIQGSVNIPRVREVTAVGNFAYLGNDAALWAVDISRALDEDLGTKVPASASPSVAMSSGFDAVAAHGNYLLAAGTYAGLRVYDISIPSTPVLVGVASTSSSSATCGAAAVPFRWKISTLGSRAYVTSFRGLSIYELH